MNPLQEHAHLFANGKFKIVNNNVETPMKFTAGQLSYMEMMSEHGHGFDNYTLIARPIESLTDGEVEEIYNASCESIVELSHDSCEQMREFWEERTKSGNLKFVTARKMLAKGVYPFDQSHFDDGTVIDSTTL